MSNIVLKAPIGNLLANRIRTTAELAKIEIKMEDFDIQKTHDPKFLQSNPLGQVPILETSEGVIFETHAILRYIARLGKNQCNLYGPDELQVAQIDQWLDFISCEVQPIISAMVKPILGWIPANQEVLKMQKEAKQDLFKVLKTIDDQLKMNSFLVGHGVTLADISLHGNLVSVFRFCLEEKLRNTYGNVTRWFETISQKPEFIKYYGKYFPCKKEWVCEEEKKQDLVFDLFSYKTQIVNAPNKSTAVDFLFKCADQADVSLWYVVFNKTEGQGQILFQTESLVEGMLTYQPQLDDVRKQGYGCHYILGDIPNLEIRGLWLWQGQDVPQNIKQLPIYEYHTWKKLDIKKEEDRQLVMDYWTKRSIDEDMIDGLRVKFVYEFR